MFDTDIILTAIHIAESSHRGQVRKYTDEPYLVHPFAVAGLVRSVTDNEDMIVAAILHDTVEDSDLTINKVRAIFGKTIGSMVDDLTDKFTDYARGNRSVRKKLEAERLGYCSPEVQTIKCADLIDNTKSIVAHDPLFARLYMMEKKYLLKQMTKANPMLWALAQGYVDDYKRLRDEER